jgi:large subunit ribosomal protein L19
MSQDNKKKEEKQEDLVEEEKQSEEEVSEEAEEKKEESKTEEEEEEELPEPDPEVEEISKKEEEKLLKAEKNKIEDFRVGDTVRIYYKIIEGENTRIQPYEGIVIAFKGKGVSKTFTVRRIGADGVSIERIFPLHSPNITKLEVKRHGKVKKSKLYYLRKKKGRAAVRVKDRKTKQTAK